MEDGTRSDTAANIKKYAPKPKKTITSKSVPKSRRKKNLSANRSRQSKRTKSLRTRRKI